MKLRLHSVILAAMAVISGVSCAKEENGPVNEGNGKTPVSPDELHFVVTSAGSTTVKSYIENNGDGTYTPMWSKDDKLAVFIGTIDNLAAPTAVLTNRNEDGLTAKFEGTVTGVDENGTFMSFAPSSSFSGCLTDGEVEITLNSTQKPGSATIDESCDVLVAKPCDYSATDGEVTVNGLHFKRIFSVLKINIVGDERLKGEQINSFRLAAPEGVVLSGKASVNLADATISGWTDAGSALTAEYAEGEGPVIGQENQAVYFVVSPTTIAAGSEVIFEARTANYVFTKKLELAEDMMMPQSQIAVVNLTAEASDIKYSVGFAVDKPIANIGTAFSDNVKVHAMENIGNGHLLFASSDDSKPNVIYDYDYATKTATAIHSDTKTWYWTMTYIGNDKVLLPSKANGRVDVLDLGTNEVTTGVVSGLSQVLRACADSEGNLYVLLRDEAKVYKYNGISAEGKTVVLDAKATDNQLWDMCFDNDGNLLVLGKGAIYCIAPGSTTAEIVAGNPQQEGTNDHLGDYIGNAADLRFVKGQTIFCDSKGYVWFNDAWNMTRVLTKGKTGYKDGNIRVIWFTGLTGNNKLRNAGQFCESPSDKEHEVLALSNDDNLVLSIEVQHN